MKLLFYLFAGTAILSACNSNSNGQRKAAESVVTDTTAKPVLPAPDTNASKNKFSKVIGWPEGKVPVAPEGFTVTKFAENIKSPRNIYVAPNGDIFVVLSNSERSAAENVDVVWGV